MCFYKDDWTNQHQNTDSDADLDFVAAFPLRLADGTWQSTIARN
jgi:hypothetical protein